MTDPLHQFQIHVIAPLFRIGGVQFNFTNASVFMLLIVALVCTVLMPLRQARARALGLQSVGRSGTISSTTWCAR
jgi:hypothetical protein